MLPRLPEALMRVAPNWGLYNLAPFSSRGANNTSSQVVQQQQQGPLEIPALAPLRQHMGLMGQHTAVGGAQELKAPVHVLQVRPGPTSASVGLNCPCYMRCSRPVQHCGLVQTAANTYKESCSLPLLLSSGTLLECSQSFHQVHHNCST
jgi:hypothetical protein